MSAERMVSVRRQNASARSKSPMLKTMSSTMASELKRSVQNQTYKVNILSEPDHVTIIPSLKNEYKKYVNMIQKPV